MESRGTHIHVHIHTKTLESKAQAGVSIFQPRPIQAVNKAQPHSVSLAPCTGSRPAASHGAACVLLLLLPPTALLLLLLLLPRAHGGVVPAACPLA